MCNAPTNRLVQRIVYVDLQSFSAITRSSVQPQAVSSGIGAQTLLTRELSLMLASCAKEQGNTCTLCTEVQRAVAHCEISHKVLVFAEASCNQVEKLHRCPSFQNTIAAAQFFAALASRMNLQEVRSTSTEAIQR